MSSASLHSRRLVAIGIAVVALGVGMLAALGHRLDIAAAMLLTLVTLGLYCVFKLGDRTAIAMNRPLRPATDTRPAAALRDGADGGLPVGAVSARQLVGIEAFGDPALVVGDDYRVIAANSLARSVFGERVVAEDLRLVLRHPVVLDAVQDAARHGEPIVREVTGLGGSNGAYRARIVDVGPDPERPASTRLLLTFADITQTRLTERMRVDFVANASHELRTPLATLLGFIETLQGPAAEDEPARRRFLEIMAREAARMSRLIDDLLSLSRIELDKYVRPQTALDLPPLIVDVAKTLAMRLEADRRSLQIDLDDGSVALPQVIADRDQILQVLHNLISNALKYGRSGTPIRVRVERLPPVGTRSEPMLRVSVTDEGDGISPEHLPRLTERFYRVDTKRSRSIGGTGLGLAIVKHIIERHRGQLEIASRPGEGTRIAFTLPEVGRRPG